MKQIWSKTNFDITVVTPTLGGGTLIKTIKQLNRGTVVPGVILVCIPETMVKRLNEKILEIKNVKIVRTKCKGQVAQRIEGFKKANSEWVLQLDDDIHVFENCLEKLYKCAISMKNHSVIAPAFVYTSDHTSICKNEVKEIMPHKIKSFLYGSKDYREGSLTRTGENFGVDATKKRAGLLVPVEWVPGGCALHYRENLVLENFYPYPGKAFSEDVLHSIMMRKKEINLYVLSDAICGLDDRTEKGGLIDHIKLPIYEYRIKRYIVDQINGSQLFLILDKIIGWVFRVIKLWRKAGKRS